MNNKQALGQFFTPPTVVSFIYDILKLIFNKEEKWLQGKHASVIDPACGEGIFLKIALEKKFTKPKYVFGIDIDENAKKKWEDITLLKIFGSKAKMSLHFFHQNGLLPLPQKTLRYKRGGLNEYDLVTGNPPYGGVGLREKITPTLEKALLNFDVWRKAFGEDTKYPRDLFTDRTQIERELGDEKRKKLEKFPIEILFLERFVQLAKHGGYVAIIIPDGILANVELKYVRNWLFEKTKVMAIISLPRETFKSVGTTAKTSILFLQKLSEAEKPSPKQEIFMASAEYIGVNASGKNDLPVILQEFRRFIHREGIKEVHMSPHFTTVVEGTKDTLHRIDADYWHPKYTKLERVIKNSKYKSITIGETQPYITNGTHNPGCRLRGQKSGILFVGQTNIRDTGLDFSEDLNFVPAGSVWDEKRARLNYEDIIIARSGVASIGRTAVFGEKLPAVVSGFVNLLRQKVINPYYVVVFLKSKYGKGQIERFFKGTGTVNITFGHIRDIKIPLVPQETQRNVEIEYKKMAKYHDLAMEAKARMMKRGKNPKEAEQDPDYQNYIRKAKDMLDDLVRRTEEIIEGKGNDIS